MPVTDKLMPYFPEIMDVEFTAQMEDILDKIEEGEREWVDTVRSSTSRSSATSSGPSKEMDDVKRGEPTGEICPECGSELLEKRGRFGKFLACSAYPDCKYTQDLGGLRQKIEDEPTNETCPTCGKAMVIKHGRFGKFIACSGYPECKTTKPVTLGIPCAAPGCDGQLVERRAQARADVLFGCSDYPNCKFVGVGAPGARACPKCQAPFLTERVARDGVGPARCVREGCGFKQELAPGVA